MQSGLILPKLELLIRLGLMPINLLPIVRRALLRIKTGIMLTPEDRYVLGILIDRVLDFCLDDPTTYQRFRTYVATRRSMPNAYMHESANPMKKAMEKLTPEMLTNLSRSILSKFGKGKPLRKSDLILANRAKAYKLVKHKMKRKVKGRNVAVQPSFKKKIKEEVVYRLREDRRREELKGMPEGMLNNIANNINAKLRAGGKISPEEKKLASRAKAELRRRRDNAGIRLGEESQKDFLRAMIFEFFQKKNLVPQYHRPTARYHNRLADSEHNETRFQSKALHNKEFETHPQIASAIHNFAKDKRSFHQALSQSKVEKIHRGTEVGNSEIGQGASAVEDRLKSRRVARKIANSEKLDRPIVLRHRDAAGQTHHHLLAGNTRATHIGYGVEAHHIDV